MIEEVFRLSFLLQVGLCSLLHQVLQVIGVLLHPGQQVVEDAGAALPIENTGRVASGHFHTKRSPVKAQHHPGFIRPESFLWFWSLPLSIIIIIILQVK